MSYIPLKYEILSFVKKVERKAVASVQERFNERLLEATERALAVANINELLENTQATLSAFVQDRARLINAFKLNFKMANKYSYSGQSEFENIFAVVDVEEGYKAVDLKQKLLVYYKPQTDEYVAIEEERDTEIQSVEGTYRKLKNTLNAMTSNKRMLLYLKELGFDTSSIEREPRQPEAIDTSKLFVCGDRE